LTKRTLRAAVAAAIAGSAGATAQVGWAQQSNTAGLLEEIVVTATRRAQDLQEVPISIVAITGDGLQMRGLQNVESLNATIPNLSVMGSAGGAGTTATSFRVRGIPGVGTYIDGIWQITNDGMLTEEFVDIERIEVLRGPQGTLFGRDSTGGALRIFTAAPADEAGATFKGTVGTFNRRDAQFKADLPLGENVKTKWVFTDANRDGYITSTTTGRKGGGIDQSNYRGDILWTPTDNLDIRAQYGRRTSDFIEPRIEDGVWQEAIIFPTVLPLLYTNAGLPFTQESQQAGWPGGEVGKWENRSQITIPNRIVADQASLDINLALTDSIELNFLTGYTDQSTKNFVDYDNSQFGLVEDTIDNRTEFFSQEIQLAGGGDRIQWVTGVFYWDESRRTRSVRYAAEEFNVTPIGREDNQLALDLYNTPYCQALLVSPPPGPASTCQDAMVFYKGFSTLRNNNNIGGNLSETGTDGYAFFGEATFNLTDKLTMTFGGRYHDQDNYNQPMTPFNVAPQFTNMEFAQDPLAGANNGAPTLASFDKSTFRLSGQYQLTDNVMGYASFSQGFNSGGAVYITEPVTGNLLLYPFKPESLDNFEIGVRSDLLDGRLRFNATLFNTIWDDIQVNLALRYCDASGACFDLPAVVPQNLGKAKAQGAEFELIYAATDKLTFNMNLGLLDTKYTDIYLDNTAAYVAGETEFSQAPETTGNIGIQYDTTLQNGGSFTTRLDYSYVSQYWRSPDPTLRLAFNPSIPEGFSDETGDFGTVNLRFVYTPPSDAWDLALFGTNLTDEYILNSGFFHGIWGYDFATVARPREVGASLTFRF
jgi:iron complex outermembrane recepter protein